MVGFSSASIFPARKRGAVTQDGIRGIDHPTWRKPQGACTVKEIDENGDAKEGREWRLPGLLYADDLILCGESEEDLRAMVGRFVEVCRIRGKKNSM